MRSGLPVSVNWTFFARRYGWGTTNEYRFKIGNFTPWGPVDPKFQVEGVAPTNYSYSQKTRLNDLSYGIKIWTNLYTVLSQCVHAFDRQTDSFLLTRLHCIECSAVKSKVNDQNNANGNDCILFNLRHLSSNCMVLWLQPVSPPQRFQSSVILM